MPKLFKIIESDGNVRDTYAHVKAQDIDVVIDWLKTNYFKPEALDVIEIDIQSDSDAFIMWSDPACADCEDNATCDQTDDAPCVESLHYLEITEINNPEKSDFEYKTIYGTNEHYDLTTQPPTAQDWDKELSNTWKRNPQKGANLLLKKTLDAQAQGKQLTEQ